MEMKESRNTEKGYEREKRETRKKKYSWLLAVPILVIAIFAVWKIDLGGEEQPITIPVGRTPLDNLPTTLDPRLFSGNASRAYALAAQIPQTVAQIHCYCNCDMESLLICYTNDHAANCDECQEEVFMASDLLKKGYTVDQIRQKIHERFG
jgi:hypothetical protein